ncbi:hypothetical protein [Kitasatospora sp. NPDC097691]|uniref:hypothetical protein n=1 Tax=Kitasatospora sp. NPDC097691 TaxID=3157231 RepID=UPI003328183F
MTPPPSALLDRAGYLAVRRHADGVFDLASRLPDQVFRTAPTAPADTLFGDFDTALTPGFWPVLQAMARWHGDDLIHLLVIRPDTETYYLPEYGMYPAVSLPVGAGEDDYRAVIEYEPNDDFAGALAISAEVIAITGPSGRWGCWAERDPEVAVFRGFPDQAAKHAWCSRFGPFIDASGALEDYLEPVFRGSVPVEYAARLTANYGG